VILFYSVKHLRRHPSEVPITLDQWAEVAYMADMIDRMEAESGASVVAALTGAKL
jgi:hypothetical protein